MSFTRSAGPRKPTSAVAAGQAARATTCPLSPTQIELVRICVEAVRPWGLSPSVGQIFGVIYVSRKPLAFADVAARLELSKGSVSQGLRFLRTLGAIKRVVVPGDRRELYVAETELRRLLTGLLKTRVSMPLQAGVERLKTIQRQLAVSDEPDRDFLAQRLAGLRAWHRKALFILPVAQKFLGSKG